MDLKRDMDNIHSLKYTKEPETQYLSLDSPKSDPRYKSSSIKQTINDEINGLLHHQAFAFVKQKSISPDANILGGRFILAIKQPRNPNERYKAIFIAQRHKEKDKDLIIHTSQTFRHRNIHLMSSIADMFRSHKIRLQDVTQACVERHDLQRDLYVKPAK